MIKMLIKKNTAGIHEKKYGRNITAALRTDLCNNLCKCVM